MKNRVFRFAISMVCFWVLFTGTVQAQITWPPIGMNGSGTEFSPYEITTAAQLAALADYVNDGNGALTAGIYYLLVNDIDLRDYASGFGWNPIGNYSSLNATFQGNFDGNGKVISNLTINRDTTDYIGLFGYIYSAVIHDLGIENCNLIGYYYVGGLVGYSEYYSTINNCFVNGKVTGKQGVGGLGGNMSSTTLFNSYSICDVFGTILTGGLTGFFSGKMHSCFASGKIKGSEIYVGGLAGIISGVITNCYATVNVIGDNYIGGLAGVNKFGIITNCYATGNVIGTGGASYLGGLVGSNSHTIRNCIAANDTISTSISGANINRFVGSTNSPGSLSNNYANEDMVVISNGVIIYPVSGTPEAGIDISISTLKTLHFYDEGNNWFDQKPWSIDNVANNEKAWRICDTQMLPYLQWEEEKECTVAGMFCGGDGTQHNPYLICTAEQLAALATYVNAGNGPQTAGIYYKLVNDIDLSGYAGGEGWNPIGNCNTRDCVFQGDFDGNGKIITNLAINRGSTNIMGLFGYIFSASIHDLGIDAGQVNGKSFVGSLVGYSHSSKIFNCYSSCDVGGTSEVGGLAGYNLNIITNCYATGNVTGTYLNIGGLVGLNSGNITYCYATGKIIGIGNASFIGGLTGSCNEGTIRNCVAANDTVSIVGISGLRNNINRISGSTNGNYSNNYAFEDMAGIRSGGEAGISMDMNTLMAFDFYNSETNNVWFQETPWSIDKEENILESWRICDGETLPFLQWQTDIECSTCGGSGTISDPYLICTAEQLAALAEFVNDRNGDLTAGIYYKLMNDIDLSEYATGEGWNPIGYFSYDSNTQFQGNFDGNGKVVSNLFIEKLSTPGVGLFGSILNANIHDLEIGLCRITGWGFVGGLVGWDEGNSTINYCYITGEVSATDGYAGGLIGVSYYSTISHCYADCNVNSSIMAGGFVGANGSIIRNCYSYSNVHGTNAYVGGFVGGNEGFITNCYATGNVIGGIGRIGGLAGVNHADISYCYANGNVTEIGMVSSYGSVGGLIGSSEGARSTTVNCVAANNTVSTMGTIFSIHRIFGSPYGYLSNNYAFEDMIVTYNNGVPVVIVDGSSEDGFGVPLLQLISFEFYNKENNWDGIIPWDIDTADNPSTIWRICDGETFPFLQWQTDIECGSKAPYRGTFENKNITNITEQNRKPSFSIYPNPTTGELRVESEELRVNNVEIFDVYGRKCLTTHYSLLTTHINISHLPAGIYFIRIISENNICVQKFIKQ